MIADFLAGVRYVLRGFALLRRPGLRRFIAIPLLINTLLFAAAAWWGWRLLENHLLGSLPGWLQWLTWVIAPLFSVAMLLIVFYTFTLLANLIGAPFNSLLAEKVEALLGGETPRGKTGLAALAGDTAKSIFSELRKLLYLALWSIPLLLLFLIPGVNAAAPFLWFAFSAWMLTLEYADCPMGNHGLTFGRQRQLLKRRRWLAWGFGGAMLAMTLIPVLNFFAMPVGVIAATVMWVEEFR